jgi:hypothetical protein
MVAIKDNGELFKGNYIPSSTKALLFCVETAHIARVHSEFRSMITETFASRLLWLCQVYSSLFKHRAPYFVSSCNFLQFCPGSGMRYGWSKKNDHL